MSLVKWVEPNFLLTDDDKSRYSSIQRKRDMIPVIPLTALAEVVEGLKRIAEPNQDPLRHSTDSLKALSATLGMLNTGREEARRLLAQLAQEKEG